MMPRDFIGSSSALEQRHCVSENAGINGRDRRSFRDWLRAGWLAQPGEALSGAQAGKARQALLAKAGLVIENADGKYYDRFRDRIMFPILNLKGMIVGFGGRVLEQGEPKYLNSPETPLFQKGRELYNLFAARRAIRQAGRVIVVEGYMDVVALSQHGIEYAVAALGTATTPYHVQKLLRQTDNVVFCFDGDNAGRKKAAWRALEDSLAQLEDGKNVSFLFLPEGEDPDSYVRNFGREAFEELSRTNIASICFFVQGTVGTGRPQNQRRARQAGAGREAAARTSSCPWAWRSCC